MCVGSGHALSVFPVCDWSPLPLACSASPVQRTFTGIDAFSVFQVSRMGQRSAWEVGRSSFPDHCSAVLTPGPS